MSLCDPQWNGRAIVDYWQGASLRVKSYDKGCTVEKRETEGGCDEGREDEREGVGG